VHIITPDQWGKVNFNYPVFYNNSDEVVSVRQSRGGEIENILIALPGHLIQLIAEQAYFTRITQSGILDQFLIFPSGEAMLRSKDDFRPERFLSVLRLELKELLIPTCG